MLSWNPGVARRRCRMWPLVALILLAAPAGVRSTERDIEVRFASEARSEPFTGRVYVFFSQQRDEPRRGPGWFRPEQFIARDLVAHIDGHYRTMPDRLSLGLAGHSMGGYGATRIGMKHEDTGLFFGQASDCRLQLLIESAKACLFGEHPGAAQARLSDQVIGGQYVRRQPGLSDGG